jgi:hypothetical protein
MSSTAEYSVSVETGRDEATGEAATIFHFSTVREFRSFQYRIDMTDELDPVSRTITLRIGGVRAPSSLVPSSGSASTKIIYTGLSGDYTVHVTGARQSESFRLHVAPDGLDIEPIEGAGSGFVEVGVVKRS